MTYGLPFAVLFSPVLLAISLTDFLPLLTGGVITLTFFYLAYLVLYFLRLRGDLVVRRLFYIICIFLIAGGLVRLFLFLPESTFSRLVVAIIQATEALAGVAIIYHIHLRLNEIVHIPTRRQHEKLQQDHLRTRDILQQHQDHLHFHREFSPIGMAITDLKGHWREVNPGMCKMLGYRAEELVSRPYKEIVHPRHHPESRETFLDLLSGRLAHGDFERELICKDGTHIWAQVNVRVVRDHHDKPSYLVVQMYDITQLKEREQQLQYNKELLEGEVRKRTLELRRINDDLEHFVYSISHDLRQPIRQLKGFIDLGLEDLSRSTADQNGLPGYLSAMQQSTERMDRLLTDLLTFSRTQQADLQKTEVDMESLIIDVFRPLRDDYSDKQLDFRITGQLPPAWGDQTALRQVWQNLLSNALKYSRHRPVIEIRISGKVEDDYCCYSISDNGEGFASQDSAKLFHLFHRLNPNGEVEGTGTGLAIVERIIHKHEGDIRAEGRPGVGASFIFRLPLHRVAVP